MKFIFQLNKKLKNLLPYWERKRRKKRKVKPQRNSKFKSHLKNSEISEYRASISKEMTHLILKSIDEIVAAKKKKIFLIFKQNLSITVI